ncbi:hypothetical protein MA16_Dca003464 [Dendrobium catenatum]|uniref:Uncharacterized protein n=1 Tax=Dendrobium catenatum TaxID=906689 RepID=A0A2I0WF15_9ASPA|nr:hypothetical protein MA16_Dca003464 [Dendrobium catenatum]
MAFKRSDPGFLEGKHSKSFIEVLSGSVVSKSFPNFRVSTIRGLSALWFLEDEFLHLAKPFDFALVGKFPLKRLTLDSIRRFFFNLKLSADFSCKVVGHKKLECSKLVPQVRSVVELAAPPVASVSEPLVFYVNPNISSTLIANSVPLCVENVVNAGTPSVLEVLGSDSANNGVVNDVLPSIVSPIFSPVCVGSPMSLAVGSLDGLGDAVLPGTEVGVLSAPLLTPDGVNISKVVDSCPVVAEIEHSAAPSPALGVVDSHLSLNDVSRECGRVENLIGNSVCSNILVDVPINLVNTHTMVNHLGDFSGFDIRNHGD